MRQAACFRSPRHRIIYMEVTPRWQSLLYDLLLPFTLLLTLSSCHCTSVCTRVSLIEAHGRNGWPSEKEVPRGQRCSYIIPPHLVVIRMGEQEESEFCVSRSVRRVGIPGVNSPPPYDMMCLIDLLICLMPDLSTVTSTQILSSLGL